MGVTFGDETEVKKSECTPSIGPLPWSPCAAEMIDKFGVGGISQPRSIIRRWDSSIYKIPE